MTYSQIRETIRDICTPYGVNDIKKANSQLKKILVKYLLDIRKVEDEFSTIVWYTVKVNGEYEDIGFDFWNHQIV